MILQGSALVVVTACLVIVVVLPFAFFASVGRGYLLPIGVAILALMMANLVAVAGWGEYFPWAVPGLYAQGKTALAPISYLDRDSDRAGGDGRDVSVVEVRRPEPVSAILPRISPQTAPRRSSWRSRVPLEV